MAILTQEHRQRIVAGSLRQYMDNLVADNAIMSCAECALKTGSIGEFSTEFKVDENKLICQRCNHNYIFEHA